eukprot:CAMPEP_0198363000 /NCGR_PEP_ID=MMETSP1450-20131203/148146_1 /TAXON_ID=753684 ORGANISM="Madagascaria erythrocladiodes, Strain CCMP3234" /NCGR_SAMPLE_ID=MMETSP1450 /ASSEMBLY_ACC=CAM_ASM_001115 /LENGTH=51 /DNA_ID=CAMNT_0044070285 /DNA_START=68 /DNA_END=220 /DNA_ORIENTATION=-
MQQQEADGHAKVRLGRGHPDAALAHPFRPVSKLQRQTCLGLAEENPHVAQS